MSMQSREHVCFDVASRSDEKLLYCRSLYSESMNAFTLLEANTPKFT